MDVVVIDVSQTLPHQLKSISEPESENKVNIAEEYMRRICTLKQPYRVVRTSRGLKQGKKKAYELLNSLFTKITEACWKRTFLKRFSISKIRRKKIVKLKKMRFKKFQLRKKSPKKKKRRTSRLDYPAPNHVILLSKKE